jgi:predicted LPLAT superfamily acyltransferase
MKESAKRYKIFIQSLPRYHCGLDPQSAKSKKKTIENLVFSYVAELENIVKQYPEQWFNYYKFWK